MGVLFKQTVLNSSVLDYDEEWFLKEYGRPRCEEEDYMKGMSFNAEMKALSELYGIDREWYLAMNPDVVKLKVDPFWHYHHQGRFEGRKANASWCSSEKYLAVAIMAKDEERTLGRFVAYHLLNGFEQVIIYDNNSEGQLMDMRIFGSLAPYVVVIPFPGKAKKADMLSDAVTRFKNKFRWMLLVDADEYVISHVTESFRELVEQQDAMGRDAFGINYVMFGSSGRTVYSPDAFGCVHAHDVSEQSFKSCVRLERIVGMRSPHDPLFLPTSTSQELLDLRGQPIRDKRDCGSFALTNNTDIAQVNHYYASSLEDYVFRKAARGRDDTGDTRRFRAPIQSDMWWTRPHGIVDVRLRDRFSQSVQKLMMEAQCLPDSVIANWPVFAPLNMKRYLPSTRPDSGLSVVTFQGTQFKMMEMYPIDSIWFEIADEWKRDDLMDHFKFCVQYEAKAESGVPLPKRLLFDGKHALKLDCVPAYTPLCKNIRVKISVSGDIPIPFKWTHVCCGTQIWRNYHVFFIDPLSSSTNHTRQLPKQNPSFSHHKQQYPITTSPTIIFSNPKTIKQKS